MQPREIIDWYKEAGVDEIIQETPVNRLVSAPVEEAVRPLPASLRPQPIAHNAGDGVAKARALADSAKTRDELKAMVESFDGLAIKKMAMNTVFSDGNPNAKVMLIGEAPGAQEDIQGIPFCGPSGQLLDKMLGAIGLTRAENVYISNTLFWRPPGNRTPSKEEVAICEPFIEKHIALMNPKLLIFCGGVAATSLLKKEVGISRLRGKMHAYKNQYIENEIPVGILFHPSYLLRSPNQKRLAWDDLLSFKAFLEA